MTARHMLFHSKKPKLVLLNKSKITSNESFNYLIAPFVPDDYVTKLHQHIQLNLRRKRSGQTETVTKPRTRMGMIKYELFFARVGEDTAYLEGWECREE